MLEQQKLLEADVAALDTKKKEEEEKQKKKKFAGAQDKANQASGAIEDIKKQKQYWQDIIDDGGKSQEQKEEAAAEIEMLNTNMTMAEEEASMYAEEFARMNQDHVLEQVDAIKAELEDIDMNINESNAEIEWFTKELTAAQGVIDGLGGKVEKLVEANKICERMDWENTKNAPNGID